MTIKTDEKLTEPTEGLEKLSTNPIDETKRRLFPSENDLY
jgi:hypothetical protein